MSKGRLHFRRYLLAVVLGAALLGALAYLAYLFTQPGSDARLTEFYLLGGGGRAGGYPTSLAAGEPAAVTAVIVNREYREMSYRLVVSVNDAVAREISPIQLPDKGQWAQTIGFSLPEAGEHQKVEFRLYVPGTPEAYRSLFLWVDVSEG
ncbi:MAG: DUF1616 domain-containing protein [Chloroflexi bacterium]|nr:DUF1616 domain-containing protein [Chloroflexota bacterium]